MATNRKRYTTYQSRGKNFWTNIVGYVFVALGILLGRDFATKQILKDENRL